MLSTVCLTLVRLSIVAFYRRLHDTSTSKRPPLKLKSSTNAFTELYNRFLIAFATVISLVGIVITFMFSFQCCPAV